MTVVAPVALSVEAASRYLELAARHVLSGVHPYAGDPFQRGADLEVAGQELVVATPSFAGALRRATGGGSVVVLSLGTGDSPALVVGGGWEIEVPANPDEWWEVASAVDLQVNGLEFVLTGPEGRWAVLVLPDALLVGGPPEFVAAYFGTPEDKRHEAEVFSDLTAGPDAYDGLRRLAGYVRSSGQTS